MEKNPETSNRDTITCCHNVENCREKSRKVKNGRKYCSRTPSPDIIFPTLFSPASALNCEIYFKILFFFRFSFFARVVVKRAYSWNAAALSTKQLGFILLLPLLIRTFSCITNWVNAMFSKSLQSCWLMKSHSFEWRKLRHVKNLTNDFFLQNKRLQQLSLNWTCFLSCFVEEKKRRRKCFFTLMMNLRQQSGESIQVTSSISWILSKKCLILLWILHH